MVACDRRAWSDQPVLSRLRDLLWLRLMVSLLLACRHVQACGERSGSAATRASDRVPLESNKTNAAREREETDTT